MKTLIFIAAALILTSACSDTEKVLPYPPTLETAIQEVQYNSAEQLIEDGQIHTIEKDVDYDDARRYEDDQIEYDADFNTQNGLRSSDIDVDQAPTETATFFYTIAHDCRNCKDQTRESGQKYYGELLPASFIDCATVIRMSDGQLLQVINAKEIPASYRNEGSKIAFSYEAVDVETTCQIGTPIKLKSISFLKGNDSGSDRAKETNSGTK